MLRECFLISLTLSRVFKWALCHDSAQFDFKFFSRLTPQNLGLLCSAAWWSHWDASYLSQIEHIKNGSLDPILPNFTHLSQFIQICSLEPRTYPCCLVHHHPPPLTYVFFLSLTPLWPRAPSSQLDYYTSCLTDLVTATLVSFQLTLHPQTKWDPVLLPCIKTSSCFPLT